MSSPFIPAADLCTSQRVLFLAAALLIGVPPSLNGQARRAPPLTVSESTLRRSALGEPWAADLAGWAPSTARTLPGPLFPTISDSIRPPRGLAALVVSGVLAWGVGALAGGALGYSAERKGILKVDSGDDPGITGALFGAAIGPCVFVPVTVHLVNHRRGSLPYGILGTALAAAVPGILAASTRRGYGPVFLGSIPFLQIATAIWVERRTGR